MSDAVPDSPQVWIDGALVSAADAVVPFDDHGLTVGDGVFETIKLVGGQPFAATRHLVRLARSLDALGLPHPDPDELAEAMAAVAAAHDRSSAAEDALLRVTVTGGHGPLGSPRAEGPSRLIVAVRPGAVRVAPTGVVIVPWTRNERGALAGVKSTSYAENVVALAHATERGASEAIFANTRGDLCEGTGSNVFVVIGDELVTPTVSSGCLAGVNRELLLEVLGPRVVERDVPIDALRDTPEAFLTSTTREVQPISTVDGVDLPACPGPHTRFAREVWLAQYGPGTDLDP